MGLLIKKTYKLESLRISTLRSQYLHPHTNRMNPSSNTHRFCYCRKKIVAGCGHADLLRFTKTTMHQKRVKLFSPDSIMAYILPTFSWKNMKITAALHTRKTSEASINEWCEERVMLQQYEAFCLITCGKKSNNNLLQSYTTTVSPMHTVFAYNSSSLPPCSHRMHQ